jgi:methionine-rich copper-binding protein CopC
MVPEIRDAGIAARLRPMPTLRHPGRRLGPAACAAAFALLVLPAATLAHAELESSSPGVGATVTGPVDQVVLTFAEAITDKSFFRIEAGGQQVARGSLDPDDRTQMLAQTGNLGPGTYTVKWVNYAEDQHQEKGDFEFTIAAATSPPATPTAAPTPSVAPSDSPSPVPTASPAPAPTLTPVPVPTASPQTPVNTSSSDVVVPIVATVILVAALGLWLLRRQRRV